MQTQIKRAHTSPASCRETKIHLHCLYLPAGRVCLLSAALVTAGSNFPVLAKPLWEKTLYMTGQLVSVGGGRSFQATSDLMVTYLVTLELDPTMTSPSYFLVYWGGSALTFYCWLFCTPVTRWFNGFLWPAVSSASPSVPTSATHN